MINGNAFYYGRVLVSYNPFLSYDTTQDPDAISTQFSLCAESQRPRLFLDPTTSQGGVMKLPLLWPLNGFDLTSLNPIALGEITMRGLSELGHANDGDEPISIQVWAWMEDVHLEVPTAVDSFDLAPQSGDEKVQSNEEYKGIISKPAMTIAAIAGKLATVPAIAPYAKATQIVASGVGNVARLFGYSKPNTVDNIEMYSPRYFGNMASTQGVDTTFSLAGDPKRELTIDPATINMPRVDELHFQHLGKKESYIGTFDWSTSDSANAVLNQILVTPIQYLKELDGAFAVYQFATTAFMSLPFEFWRGSLRFRFQIISSNFHRGRLRIAYDPLTSSAGDVNENTTMNRMVDIATEKDFVIEVGWGTEYPWLTHLSPDGLDPPFGTDVAALYDVNQHNGILTTSIVNELTTPNSTAQSVSVAVYVSAGEDFEVAVPSAEIIKTMSYFQNEAASLAPLAPQSGDEEDIMANTPIIEQPTQRMLESSTIGTSQDVFFADPFVSFRTLMKRYTKADAYKFDPPDGSLRIVQMRFPHRPFCYGYDPNGIHATEDSLSFNYASPNFISYVLPAYGMYRGSFRWKTHLGQINDSQPATVSMSSTAYHLPKFETEFSEDAPGSSAWAFGSCRTESGNTGMIATVATQNPVLEFEAPWYSNLRWSCPRNLSPTTSSLTKGLWTVQERDHVYTYSSIGDAYIQRFVAAGEDLMCGYFLGMPVVAFIPLPLPQI
jgi:hypothetical protein